jgi:integrase
MLLRVNPIVSVQTRYIQQRGSVFQFVMRVPKDLVDRVGKKFIRVSLKTSDLQEALRRAEPLAIQYQAQFSSLQADKTLVPAYASKTPAEVAAQYSSIDEFMTHIVDPRLLKHPRGDDAEPEEILNPFELQVVDVLNEGKGPLRLSGAIKLYWKTHKKAGDPSFVAGVQRDWNKLIAHVGDIPLEKLAREQARTFVDQLASEGNKTTTIRRCINHLKAVISAAIRESELTKANPFSALRIANEGQDATAASVPGRSTLEDIARALQDDSTPVGILAMVLMDTGTRIGEFSGMKVSDVFLDAPVPFVRVKANEWRTLKTGSSKREFPLVGMSLEAMKKALTLPRTSDALFPSYGRKRGQDSASAAVNKRLQKWGITSKSFRHSLKDRLREVGCPKDIRDAIQGHENGEVAEVYGLGHTLKTMQDWLEKAKVVV